MVDSGLWVARLMVVVASSHEPLSAPLSNELR